MDIGRFFVCFSLSVAIDIFFHPISKEQHSRLFLHYILFSYRHQFKQKKKDSVRRERNFLFIPSIAFDTHTHSRRYSGICLLGNVVSEQKKCIDNYLSQRERTKRQKRLLFLDAGVSRW